MKPSRILAVLLSLGLPLNAAAQALSSPSAVVDVSTESAGFAPIKVTAPRPQTRVLKAARAGGAGVAAGGLGIFAYSVIFDAAGPIGVAAGLIFLGGMTAYLSHRGLHGHDDFSPDEARKGAAAPRRP